MDTNALPAYDASDNPTGCCPRFDPRGWDGQRLHFRDKLFLRATTRSILYFPLDMGRVFERVFATIDVAKARSDEDFVVLSRDLSAWSAEHLFAVTRDVPGMEMIRLSGDFVTTVFEGAYRNAPKWKKEMATAAARAGERLGRMFFFYTTCPRCAKHYGKNYVVGLAEVA